MRVPAYREGRTLFCPFCRQKVGVVQADGSVVHHDYRTRVTLVEGRMELDCQKCRAELELRTEVTA